MFEKSGVYAKSVFIKAHFFGQPFKVLKVDKTLVDYYTKLSDFCDHFASISLESSTIRRLSFTSSTVCCSNL